ncbi:MAG TPA: enoyl-CoA hydratase/isomerase family protein [Jatrophihabitans sp.]|jgi:enoyl-CoA hydratase/carnithine racemase
MTPTRPAAQPWTIAFEPPDLRDLELEVVDGAIAILRINRPDRMNTQTVRMFTEHNLVARALRESHARALIITGAGERAFCPGFDLDEIDVITRMGVRDFLKFQETATKGIQALHSLPFPVIAAIHGAATGGGLALALACDVRIAAPTAKLSAAFVKVGLSAGELGTSWHLTRLVGPGRAAEIVYTARVVGAQEALRIGLVNRVVPTESLMEEALELARQISSNSPGGMKITKRALQHNEEIGSYGSAMELENRGQALLAQTSDMREALAAFKQRRPARFSGE